MNYEQLISQLDSHLAEAYSRCQHARWQNDQREWDKWRLIADELAEAKLRILRAVHEHKKSTR